MRAEPAEARIDLDGEPLDPATAGLVRFRPGSSRRRRRSPPSYACRTAERELLPTDAGGEVVLVLDPVRLSWPLDPGRRSRANVTPERRAGWPRPRDLELDLCRENVLRGRGRRVPPGRSSRIPAGATPLEARTLLALDRAGRDPARAGWCCRRAGPPVVLYVDGQRRGRGISRSWSCRRASTRCGAKNDTCGSTSRSAVEVRGGRASSAGADAARHDHAGRPGLSRQLQGLPAASGRGVEVRGRHAGRAADRRGSLRGARAS